MSRSKWWQPDPTTSTRGCAGPLSSPQKMTKLRIAFDIAAAICSHICMTPPYQEPSSEDRGRYGAAGNPNILTRLLLQASAAAKVTLWGNVALEIALFAVGHPLSFRLHVSSPAAIGLLLLSAGTTIRRAAYRALGPLFTFALSLQPPGKHILVTSGPYTYVRHPSYTGAILCAVGLTMCVFAPGGWVVEGGWLQGSTGMGLMGLWVGVSVLATGAVVRRATVEDKVLKEAFGTEWDRWAARIKWMVIPGVW